MKILKLMRYKDKIIYSFYYEIENTLFTFQQQEGIIIRLQRYCRC